MNDGSGDNTEAVLTGLAASRPWLRQIKHKQSAGQSAAIRSGMRAARAPVAVTLDGDGQNDPAFIPVLVDTLLAGGPIVLFFYPGANTRICTAEACHFRDLAAEFTAVGASRVGISADSVDVQAGFAATQSFDYPLLSDSAGTVAEQFGVKRGLLGKLAPVKRHTFVIDTDRTVRKIITGELSATVHADEALAYLQARA